MIIIIIIIIIISSSSRGRGGAAFDRQGYSRIIVQQKQHQQEQLEACYGGSFNKCVTSSGTGVTAIPSSSAAAAGCTLAAAGMARYVCVCGKCEEHPLDDSRVTTPQLVCAQVIQYLST
jgi:hypothetical protein